MQNIQNLNNQLASQSTLIRSSLQTSILALHPWFLTGFSDAESCFMVRVIQTKSKRGYQVQPSFSIGLHEKDRSLLESIKAYFGGVGKIDKQGKDSFLYRVASKKDLKVIIEHFEKYPLITQKRAVYELF